MVVSRGAPHLPRRAKMYYVAVVVLRSNGAALAVSPSTETPFIICRSAPHKAKVSSL